MTRPVGILYEHPEWFKPLFRELERQSVPFVPIDATRHTFEPGSDADRYSLVVNRMSPSAGLRGNGQAIFHTLDYLAHLEKRGASVLNGRRAFEFEISKARQLDLLARLGVRYPRAKVVNHPSQIVDAAAAQAKYRGERRWYPFVFRSRRTGARCICRRGIRHGSRQHGPGTGASPGA